MAWRRTLLWLRAAAIVAAAAVVTLDQLALPDEATWAGADGWLYAAVAVLAFAGASDTLGALRAAYQLAHIATFERDMAAVLSVALKDAVAACGAPWQEVGVHAFRSRGAGPFLRLAKVGGLRMSARPSMVRSQWRPGMGVVGLAWKTKSLVAEDWNALFATAMQNGQASWNASTKDQRYGLSWGQLQLTADYQGIVAHPVVAASGNFIGVVAVSAPCTAGQLRTPAMTLMLREFASGAAAVGSPPKGWWRHRA